ncbi:MAG: DUF1566 domain-containing protein [Deltaproteobacteria bacterium]|nr:DUF1566 domain-containing protein [Deltaproteobacteria bacterium]
MKQNRNNIWHLWRPKPKSGIRHIMASTLGGCLFTLYLPVAAHAIGPYTTSTNTVIDTATGLEWQRTDDGTIRTWINALAYCEASALDGKSDWRLPNIRELKSIVDYSRTVPAIDPAFIKCTNSDYWSATTSTKGLGGAWAVLFASGVSDVTGKDNEPSYVRCVRGGLSWTPSFLVLSKSGSGTGTVSSSSNPSGTSCGPGAYCMSYTTGATVTLIAHADAGSTFTGWSGDADCLDGSVTMNNNINCTAMFGKPWLLYLPAIINKKQ